jgi:hypothetical protein
MPRADACPGERLRVAEPAGADEDRPVPKDARREHRDRDQGFVAARAQRDVLRKGELRDLPFAVTHRALQHLLRGQTDDAQFEALHADAPIGDRLHMGVVADSKAERPAHVTGAAIGGQEREVADTRTLLTV